MADIDFLLVHVSSEQQHNRVFTMTWGLLSLADMLNQTGINCRIIHTEVEKRLDGNFDLADFVQQHSISIVGFSLQWHYQLFYTLEAIKKVKEKNPDARILLGGLTASYFAHDILVNFPDVDFIIRGDAETPLAELIKLLRNDSKKQGLSAIANLSWRDGNTIVENELSYTATSEELSRYHNGNFPLILHYKKYSLYCGGTFYYNIGRGCPVTCSFCGGSRLSQGIINRRKEIIHKNVPAIIDDLKRFKDHGMDHWYTCFDPYPGKDSFYTGLFEEIRNNNLDFRVTFESWSLPSRRFIDAFVQTFRVDTSFIIISPESGSERVRKKNKGYFYTNAELVATLRYLSQSKIKVILYFTVGLPGETCFDFAQTMELINFLRHYCPQLLINVMPISLEPASPWSLDADKFGITAKKNNFFDFYNASRHEDLLGYETPYFSEDDIRTAVTMLKMEVVCYQNESRMLTNIRKNLEGYFKGKPFSGIDIMAPCQECPHFYGCHMMASRT